MDTPDTEHTYRFLSRRIFDSVGKTLSKWQALFIAQVIIIYIVVITCIANLSLDNGKSELWVSLLGYCLGCMLPSPKVKRGDLGAT